MPQDMPSNVTTLPSVEDRGEKLRVLEALLFAATEPLSVNDLGAHLDEGDDTKALLEELQGFYMSRGVNLVSMGGKWAFRTAADLGYLLERHAVQQRRLSKAALETLAIIAYHQPVTRSEIEEIRGVSISSGTLDVLLETEWIRLRGRRRAPGRPITYGTSDAFLDHFGLETVRDLPGLKELKKSGLLSGDLPPDFEVPDPRDVAELTPDEDPLDDEDLDQDADPDLDPDLFNAAIDDNMDEVMQDEADDDIEGESQRA